MISAPSETRCRSMCTKSMIANTIASVSGIDSATTAPGRTPRLTKLHTRMIAIACHSEAMKSLIATSTVDRLVGHQRRLDAVRQVGRDVGHHGLDVLAEREDVAGVAHRDREADGRLAVDPEHRLRRVGEAAPHGGDVAQADVAPAEHQVDRLDVALGVEGAGDAHEHALLLGVQDAGRADHVLRLQRRHDRAVVQAQAGEAFGRELDEDLLVLRAQHLDLRDVGHLQQARARAFDLVAQLAEGEAVGGEARR